GFYWASWSISDSVGELSCEEAAAAGVSILTTLENADGLDDVLKCHYNGWQTGEIPLGANTVSVSLIDDVGDPIAVSEGIDATLEIDSELLDLGTFDFILE
ncbi:MAG TPA: hypothetical protein VKZ63_09290, partial [Kofleriaceae bacterium]|nr:hypothetical protein [Kofleriaceae bacterium]